MKPTTSRFSGFCLSLAIAFTMIGCQAAKTTSTSSTPPTTPVTISLNQAPVSVAAGATAQFAAKVQNTTNTTVTWSVTAGANSAAGTISATGMYTAPSQPGTNTVTATSAADPTKSASAAVAIGASSISPSSTILAPGGTQQFTAPVQGFSNNAVNWSVDQVAGGNSTVGTVTANGLYTAPSQTGAHTVTATSAADAAVSASASVTVSSISITPSTATVIGGDTQQFTATMVGITESPARPLPGRPPGERSRRVVYTRLHRKWGLTRLLRQAA